MDNYTKEMVRDTLITLIVTAGIAGTICTMVTQSQMTERLKFEKGYEEVVLNPDAVTRYGVTGWRKCVDKEAQAR